MTDWYLRASSRIHGCGGCTFKATGAQRTFGEQLVHVVEALVQLLQALDASGSVPVPTLSHEPTTPEVLERLEAAYDYGTAVLRLNDNVPPASSILNPES